MGGDLDHAPDVVRRAHAEPLARERDQEIVAARPTADAGEIMGQARITRIWRTLAVNFVVDTGFKGELAIPAHLIDRTLAQFPHRSSRTVLCTRLKVLRGPQLIRPAA
jgi:hypothetical protein